MPLLLGEIVVDEPPDVLGERHPELRRTLAGASVQIRVESDLRARHHDGDIIGLEPAADVARKGRRIQPPEVARA